MYGERQDYQEVMPEPVFTITPDATHGLYYYLHTHQDSEMRQHSLMVEMEKADANLVFAIEDIGTEWGLEEELRDRLVEGATVAYKLLSYQAEIEGRKVPKLHQSTINDHVLALVAADVTAPEYFEKRQQHFLNRANRREFMEGLCEYINIDDREMNTNEIAAFLLGGMYAFDLLHREVYPLKPSWQEFGDVDNNTRVNVSSAVLRGVIKTVREASNEQRVKEVIRAYGGTIKP